MKVNLKKQAAMVAGYLAGLDREWASPRQQRSPAFRHGYRNGKADRAGTVADGADTLRRRADMILRSP